MFMGRPAVFSQGPRLNPGIMHQHEAFPTLSPADVNQLVASVGCALAVLSSDGSVAGGNARWRAMFGSGARPEWLRAAEQDGLPRRARDARRSLVFRDTFAGVSCDVVLAPLEQGRTLVSVNPVGAAQSSGEDPAWDRVELNGASWGPLDKLSKREREVLALLAAGMTIKRIAERLSRSEKTVEGHRDSIYRKLSVSSRAELAILAMRSGLALEDPEKSERKPALREALAG
jgi:DNA-binding CsgD family transcriptional regulator